MLHKAVKVRLYPTPEQEVLLAQHFGCARWWWNFALGQSIETYRDTGKGLGRSALNALLPALKKNKETEWLGECYSQVLQAVTLNLTTAYKNFFDGRARFPRFKSKHGRQSIQYPQNVKVENGAVKLPGKVGKVKAKIHRVVEGTIKTVAVSKEPSGKYYASILTELEGEHPAPSTEGRVIGIDLGLTHFAITSDGSKVSKYENPRHIAKHEKNLKRKQQKLTRRQKGSNSRHKYRKVVARVYLWTDAEACLEQSEPTYMIDARPILEPYFERAGVTAEQISGQSLELIVASWLGEIIHAEKLPENVDSSQHWLIESGLYAAIAGGKFEHEAAV